MQVSKRTIGGRMVKAKREGGDRVYGFPVVTLGRPPMYELQIRSFYGVCLFAHRFYWADYVKAFSFWQELNAPKMLERAA